VGRVYDGVKWSRADCIAAAVAVAAVCVAFAVVHNRKECMRGIALCSIGTLSVHLIALETKFR